MEQIVCFKIAASGEKLRHLDNKRYTKAYQDNFFGGVSLSEPYGEKKSQWKEQQYISDDIKEHMLVSLDKLGYFPERRFEVMSVGGLSPDQCYEQNTVNIWNR